MQSEIPKIIRLSVGGCHYTTSLETLLSDPDSMLAAMFSGYHNVKSDEEGRYFIDRDGTHFRYILNYLRDKDATLPSDSETLVELFKEVGFYHLTGLEQKIELLLKKSKNFTLSYGKFLDIINQNMNGIQIPRVSFKEIKVISYLNFSEANFKGCDFSSVQIIECHFDNCQFKKSNFANAYIQNCIFSVCNFHQCNFTQAICSGNDFRTTSMKDANLFKANFAGGNFKKSDFIGANLQETNFYGANLEGCVFYMAMIKDSNFGNCNLKEVKGLLLLEEQNENTN